jgi:hypothetical protein
MASAKNRFPQCIHPQNVVSLLNNCTLYEQGSSSLQNVSVFYAVLHSDQEHGIFRVRQKSRKQIVICTKVLNGRIGGKHLLTENSKGSGTN